MLQTCRSSLIAQSLSSIPGSFFRVASTSSAFRVFTSSKQPGLTASSITQYTFSVIKGVLDNIGLLQFKHRYLAMCKVNCDVQENRSLKTIGLIGLTFGYISQRTPREQQKPEAFRPRALVALSLVAGLSLLSLCGSASEVLR